MFSHCIDMCVSLSLTALLALGSGIIVITTRCATAVTIVGNVYLVQWRIYGGGDLPEPKNINF